MKPKEKIEFEKRELQNKIFQQLGKQIVEFVDHYQDEAGEEVRTIKISHAKVEQRDASFKTEIIFVTPYEV